jgi:hypothetical protein
MTCADYNKISIFLILLKPSVYLFGHCNISVSDQFIIVLILSLALNAAEKGNFLWKVMGVKGGSSAYLLGSIHIVPDDIYPLSTKIEKAFENSDYLAVEADMNNIDQNKIAALTMSKGLYMDGNNLEKVMKPERYVKLNSALDSIKLLNITQVKMMKPWLAAMTIPQLMILKAGYKMDNGIDMHFLKAATAKKKPILELESAEFQLELLSGFSEDLQIKFLESALDEMSTFKEKYDEMVQAWKDDDIKKMADIMNKEIRDKPDLKPVYDKLIRDRNVTMTEKIDGWLKQNKKDTYFIVVGAGHLVDEDGIAKMLKKKGYKVEKL